MTLARVLRDRVARQLRAELPPGIFSGTHHVVKHNRKLKRAAIDFGGRLFWFDEEALAVES